MWLTVISNLTEDPKPSFLISGWILENRWQMKSIMTFIRGNRCIERMIIWKKIGGGTSSQYSVVSISALAFIKINYSILQFTWVYCRKPFYIFFSTTVWMNWDFKLPPFVVFERLWGFGCYSKGFSLEWKMNLDATPKERGDVSDVLHATSKQLIQHSIKVCVR